MGTSYFSREEFIDQAVRRMIRPETVLDIGCGIRPQQFVRPNVHICCEPFQQYIDRLKEDTATAYDRSYVFIKATWDEAVDLFPPASVDSVFIIDVIEHLDKKKAEALLKKTVEIARKQVVILTPYGFVPQHHEDGKDAWGLDGGEWQEHKSGWLPEDFGKGWETLVCKDFHTADNLGKPYDKPFGALWAVYSHNTEEKPKTAMIEELDKLHQCAIDSGSPRAIKAARVFLERILRMYIKALSFKRITS